MVAATRRFAWAESYPARLECFHRSGFPESSPAPVTNTPGVLTETTADFAWTLLMAAARRIVEADRYTRAGKFKAWGARMYLGYDVFGKTIGIVGLGNVGKRIAELCRVLFHMQVLAYDPHLNADVIRARGAEKVELDELLRRSDFVSINCPLNGETRRMIGAREYALMKPTAYFITTARGSIHDEESLEQALRDKKIAGAVLDVWEKEPPPAKHPLMKYDNVIVTPHMAGVTLEARARMGQIAAEQILDALDGKPVLRIINPQVWTDYAKRFQKTFGFVPQPPPPGPNWHATENHGDGA